MKTEQQVMVGVMYSGTHKQFRMETLPMKKFIMLSLVVAFALLGTQAFAVPPVENGPEGFIIHSFTKIINDVDADGRNSTSETEKYNWTYFEGWGKGVFYPDGSAQFACVGSNCPEGAVSQLGFTEGAEVAYSQTFEAVDGYTTFEKTFDALSDPEPGENNLVVNKKITFEQDPVTKGYAKHEEKVGLSVISMGSSDTVGNPASGLLSLCPWAADGNGTTGGGYPPVNVGVAAGSSFNVTKIVFESNSVVNSSILPKLTYDVDAVGEGTISAAFVVDLWEGPAGYVWGAVPISSITKPSGLPDDPLTKDVDESVVPCYECAPKACDPTQGQICYLLPDWEPPTAKRMSYEENASATGVWTFQKSVSFESVMPGTASSGTFPFNQVP
jgi:hypothetical protein